MRQKADGNNLQPQPAKVFASVNVAFGCFHFMTSLCSSGQRLNIARNQLMVQDIKTGTYDDIFGPGSTPSWALPLDVFKYQDDRLIQKEAGYTLDYKVSLSNDCCALRYSLHRYEC